MRTGKRIGKCLAGAAALAISSLLAGCAQKEAEPEIIELQGEAFSETQKTAVTRGDLRITASYDAYVGPWVEQLTFQEEGSFGSYRVRLGDEVQQGTVLAAPATEEIEEAVRDREKELENLTVTYEYQKSSLENQIEIAQLELDNVYNELKVLEYPSEKYTEMCAQAGAFDEQRRRLELQLAQLTETYELEKPHCEKQLQRLREKLNGNVIRAPFDGVVVALAGDGDSFSYGAAIDTSLYYVAVADPGVACARCENIPTAILEHAQKVVFWKDGKEYDVTYVPRDEEYYRVTGNYGQQAYSQFQVTDPEGEIAFGDYGKIRLIVTEKKDVLLLPATTVRSVGGVPYVYKDVDGKPQRFTVKTGSSDGIQVEILEGLEEGDVVYVQE